MEQKEHFDLIFMDVQMPNVTGIQSTRLIREIGYSAPIVALTAFAEESNVKECMDSGMDYFLPKPIRRPALKQVLKRYCPTIPEGSEETEKTPEKEKKAPLDHIVKSPNGRPIVEEVNGVATAKEANGQAAANGGLSGS